MRNIDFEEDCVKYLLFFVIKFDILQPLSLLILSDSRHLNHYSFRIPVPNVGHNPVQNLPAPTQLMSHCFFYIKALRAQRRPLLHAFYKGFLSSMVDSFKAVPFAQFPSRPLQCIILAARV